MKSWILLAAQAFAQCNPDIVVDDFAEQRFLACEECGKLGNGSYPNRYFNKMGGDYGAKGDLDEPIYETVVKINPINTVDRYMDFNATWGPEDTKEKETHPNQPGSYNYWYVKFDQIACFDLSKFSHIQFDLVAPAGSQMTFALTQKSADCKTRLIDSVYKNLTDYITPDGTKKTVKLPVSDYAKNDVGGAFDFKHLKDFTIINILPAGVHFQLSNFVLKGACSTTETKTGSPTAPSPITTKTSAAVALTGSLFVLFGFLLI